MKILICGSRYWTDRKPVEDFLRALPPDTIIVEGGARGADQLAQLCASQRGLEVREYPANWEKYGKRAGFLRNMQMLEEESPDLVIAFTHDITISKGTRHMVETAKAAGIPTCVLR